MRRATGPLLGVAVLAFAVVLVIAGGRRLAGGPAAEIVGEVEEPVASIDATSTAAPRRAPVASRVVAASEITPPAIDPAELEREAPRAPLSDIGLAQPPKPEELTPVLNQPVAVESGIVVAMDRRVAIAGIKSIPPEETCLVDGVSWPCGARARTAFRLWLRGRALTCDLPKDMEADPVVAPCRLGKQDVGQWLVSNGWARAEAGGAYTDAEDSAKAGQKGIFGAAPDLSSLPPLPDAEAATPPVDQPVLVQ